MKTGAIEKHYICNNCGYSPTNRSTWCDMGCGSDYNEMIEVPPVFVRKQAVLTALTAEVERLRGLVGELASVIALKHVGRNHVCIFCYTIYSEAYAEYRTTCKNPECPTVRARAELEEKP